VSHWLSIAVKEDITTCYILNVCLLARDTISHHFVGTCYLHLQGRKLSFLEELVAEACTNHMHFGLKGSNEEGRKQGNIEHTVVPNAALWNVAFQ
jgi:hypothetical protein